MKGTLAINLASEPARRDRPMLVASIATAVLMAGVLAMIIFLIQVESGGGVETALAMEQAQSEMARLAAEESRLQAALMQDDNAALLQRSVFLNALLLRKSISWTLIFSDLETVLPYNVKLVQVRPQVSRENEIQLEMVVASKTTEPVIDLLKNMESSDLFSSTSVSVALPPTDSEPLYRYRVSVRYNREL